MHKSKRSKSTEIYKKRKAAIKKGDLVKVTKYGKFTEIMFAKRTPPKGKVNIRHEHGSLVNGRTHKEITVKHSENRSDLLMSLKRSLKKLSHLIACNFSGRKDEKFITLTYSVPYQLDPNGAKKDWQRLYQNFSNNYPNAKYIAIFEPQGRLYYNRKGEKVPSWHIHVILLGIGSIPKEKLYSWWKFGNISFVNIGEMKKTKGINNLAEYFTSYAKKLDVEFMNEAALRIAKGKGANVLQSLNKQVAKAARLYFYPANFRIYTHSEGLKKAKKKYLLFGDVDQSRIGHPISSSTVIVKDNNGRKLNEYKRVIFERD